MNDETTATLARNPLTGDYELTLRVPRELFQRRFWKEIEDDPTIDLTDEKALARVVAKVGKLSTWLNNPFVSTVPFIASPPAVVVPPPARKVSPPKQDKTKARLLEETVRERARHIAPYLWLDECRTPVASQLLPSEKTGEEWKAFVTWLAKYDLTPSQLTPRKLEEEWRRYRADIGRLRNEEKNVLVALIEEWEHGTFIIDAEAAEEERLHQEAQRQGLTEKVEAIAGALKENGFH